MAPIYFLELGSKHKENNQFQYEDPSNIKSLIFVSSLIEQYFHQP